VGPSLLGAVGTHSEESYRPSYRTAPSPPFEGRFWSHAGLRAARLGAQSNSNSRWERGHNAFELALQAEARGSSKLALALGQQAQMDLQVNPADDPSLTPFVALFADMPHRISLHPPGVAGVAAFLFESPRCLTPGELPLWLTPDRLAAVEQATADADRLARLIFELRGEPARGGTTKPLRRLRDALCEAVRQGLALRLGTRLSTSEEQVFAYFTGLAAITLPADVKAVPPHGIRVCEVCARVFSAPRRSRCPTCRQHSRTLGPVIPDRGEIVFLRMPAVAKRTDDRVLPIEDLAAFGGIAGVRQGVDQLPSEERFVLTALYGLDHYGLDQDGRRSVERVARWLVPRFARPEPGRSRRSKSRRFSPTRAIPHVAGARYRGLRSIERAQHPGVWFASAGTWVPPTVTFADGTTLPVRDYAPIPPIEMPTAAVLRFCSGAGPSSSREA